MMLLCTTDASNYLQEDPKRPVDVHVGFSIKSYIFGIFPGWSTLLLSLSRGERKSQISK